MLIYLVVSNRSEHKVHNVDSQNIIITFLTNETFKLIAIAQLNVQFKKDTLMRS